MKLIIDIEPRYYKNMHSEVKELYYEAINRITKAVSNGIPYEERPAGKWDTMKGNYFTPGGDDVLICPFCESEESKHSGGVEFPVHWNFCPSCGADMRVKGEEE